VTDSIYTFRADLENRISNLQNRPIIIIVAIEVV
jgi:hypothetical protein